MSRPLALMMPDVTEQPVYLPPGCANSLNLQVMVEHQRDLVRGRRSGPPEAAPVVHAAERYLYGATEAELHAAVGEALAFLDQTLDAGFRPGMGNVIPDRFFWALPPGEEESEEGAAEGAADEATDSAEGSGGGKSPRHVH